MGSGGSGRERARERRVSFERYPAGLPFFFFCLTTLIVYASFRVTGCADTELEVLSQRKEGNEPSDLKKENTESSSWSPSLLSPPSFLPTPTHYSLKGYLPHHSTSTFLPPSPSPKSTSQLATGFSQPQSSFLELTAPPPPSSPMPSSLLSSGRNFMRSWLDTNIYLTIPLGFLLCYLLWVFQSWLVQKGELEHSFLSLSLSFPFLSSEGSPLFAFGTGSEQRTI